VDPRAALNSRERITLQISGDGPVRGLIADVAAGGHVRGFALRPQAERPLNSRGKFDVGGLVGRGFLHVTRTFDTGQPYTSAVPLASGEIGDDLANYFASSEQIPTVVAVGVLANPAGVLAAGGIIAQLLPGADTETIEVLERGAASLPHISALVRDGQTPEDLVHRLAGGLAPRVAGTHPVAFACRCDAERVMKAIVGLGHHTLAEMAASDVDTEATCDFCGQRYYFSPAAIREILESAS